MATVIQVEKPKEMHEEIKKLLSDYYHWLPGTSFNPARDSFAVRYPHIYHLYMQISAHAQEFALDLTPHK